MARTRHKVQAFDVIGKRFAGEFLILSSLSGPLTVGTLRQSNMKGERGLELHEFEIVSERTVKWVRFVAMVPETPLHKTESGPVRP